MAAIGGPAWHGASDRRVTPWNERTTAARLGFMAYRAAFDRGAGAEAFAEYNRRANRANDAAVLRAAGFVLRLEFDAGTPADVRRGAAMLAQLRAERRGFPGSFPLRGIGGRVVGVAYLETVAQ